MYRNPYALDSFQTLFFPNEVPQRSETKGVSKWGPFGIGISRFKVTKGERSKSRSTSNQGCN